MGTKNNQTEFIIKSEEKWPYDLKHWLFTKYFMSFVMVQHIFLSVIICTKEMLNFKHLSGEYFKLIISSKADDSTNLSSFYVFTFPLFSFNAHPHLAGYLNNLKMKLRHNYKVLREGSYTSFHFRYYLWLWRKIQTKVGKLFFFEIKGNVMSTKIVKSRAFLQS